MHKNDSFYYHLSIIFDDKSTYEWVYEEAFPHLAGLSQHSYHTSRINALLGREAISSITNHILLMEVNTDPSGIQYKSKFINIMLMKIKQTPKIINI